MKDPIASCAGKVRFETYSRAEEVATRKTRRNALRPAVYHCANCGGFHIGNSKPVTRGKGLEMLGKK